MHSEQHHAGVDTSFLPVLMGMVPELHLNVQGVWKIFHMTNFILPNDISSMIYALKSVPGPADIGVPQGDGDGPRSPPRYPWGPEKMSND